MEDIFEELLGEKDTELYNCFNGYSKGLFGSYSDPAFTIKMIILDAHFGRFKPADKELKRAKELAIKNFSNIYETEK